MKKTDEFYALEAKSNLKGEDDIFRFYIESVDGGGIVATVDTKEQAEQWCRDNNGILGFVI